jgi:hypothetical protein
MGVLVGTTASTSFLETVSASVLDTTVPPQPASDKESAKGKTTATTLPRKGRSGQKGVGTGEFIREIQEIND